MLLRVVFLVAVAHATRQFVDVKLAVDLKHVPANCRHKTEPCKLAYAISLLKAKGTYDLHALMLQDGYLLGDKHKRYLHENTVIAIPKEATKDKAHNLFLGVKIFGLPETVQDYFIVDASRALRHKLDKSRTVSEHSGIVFTAIVKQGFSAVERTTNACDCSGDSCKCCEFINIPKIYMNHTVCLVLSYLPKEYGISIVWTIDGKVEYNDTISARNPPPICLNLPYLKDYANVCIRFTRIKIQDKQFHTCISLLAELYHVTVAEHSFGCIDIPYMIEST